MYDDLNIDITPKDWMPSESMIKVIGVGGGGCNAVNYMFNQRIEGCSFIVCNTDSQALSKSPVPVKIQLGHGLLGAGTDPIKGRNAAIETQEEINRIVIESGTQMLFITAGMGGGTGTGASPVIAKMAKDKGILTVGVVTLPFKNEGTESLSKAIDGIHELQKNVDSLLIINNEKLYDFFGNQLIQDAFPKTDEVLATAVRGIIEIITKPGYINVDFEDVKTMMRASGMALMGCGSGTGASRLEDAIREALDSPLLNDFDLSTARNMLVNVTTGKNEKGMRMDELKKIDQMITERAGNLVKFKRGIIWDENPDVGDRPTAASSRWVSPPQRTSGPSTLPMRTAPSSSSVPTKTWASWKTPPPSAASPARTMKGNRSICYLSLSPLCGCKVAILRSPETHFEELCVYTVELCTK